MKACINLPQKQFADHRRPEVHRLLNRAVAKCVLVVFLMNSVAARVAGAEYYVATSGNDEAAGTQIAPWATIQHALDQAQPGDQVFLRAGVYRQIVRSVRSGAAGLPIVLSGYPGERPVIDGTDNPDSGNGIIVTHSYSTLTNLEIRNWSGNGIWTEGAGFLEISDCEVHDVCCGVGLADGTHDFTINRVVAHHFDLYGFDASASGGADCYNGTFTDCIAHTGRDPEQNVDGFALGHGTQHEFTFTRCETYNVFDGFDISSRNVVMSRCSGHHCSNGAYKLWQDNILLVNCLAYRCTTCNVELDLPEGPIFPTTVTLQNCTLVGGGQYNLRVEHPSKGLRLYGCILADGANNGLIFELPGLTNYQGDFNVFHNQLSDRAISETSDLEFSLSQIADGTWTAYSGQDQHSIVSTDPAVDLFRDLNADDFHLRPGSLALNRLADAPNVPKIDYDGRLRVLLYDIGAFEFYESVPIAQPVLSISQRQREITLGWTAQLGVEYQVLTSSNLTTWATYGIWRVGQGQPMEVKYEMPVGQPTGYFRLQAQ